MTRSIFVCLLCLWPFTVFAQLQPEPTLKEATIKQEPGTDSPWTPPARPEKPSPGVQPDSPQPNPAPVTENEESPARPEESEPADKAPQLAGEALIEPAAESPCVDGNLLSQKRPMRSRGVQNEFRITDNVVISEGGAWNSQQSAIFTSEEAYAVYDLGQVQEIQLLLFQGDNNDEYELSVSIDDQTYQNLWTVPVHPQAGMRQRLHHLDQTVQARFIRIQPRESDHLYSVSELQVFCRQPQIWPPALEVKQAVQTDNGNKKKDIESRRKIVLGLLGLLTFCGIFLSHKRKEPRWQALAVLGGAASVIYVATRTEGDVWLSRETDAFVIALIGLAVWAAILLTRRIMKRTLRATIERGALLCIVFASAYSWTNWGVFHGSRAVHLWDTFHYYVGSKYFDELGYHLIYKCVAAAEVEDGYEKDVMKRQMRDLSNNDLLQAKDYLADVSECKAAFSPERWAALKQDMRLFRSLMGEGWWAKMFKDHGFNGTPIWALFGSRITNYNWQSWVPPEGMENSPLNLKNQPEAVKAQIKSRFRQDKIDFERYLNRLALVDASFYAIIFLMIGWAFGLRAMALASLIWASGYPWAYFWTGGSFMRVTWLFAAVVGVCLLKKTHSVLGGFFVTLSGLLRIFPCALAGGVTLQIVYNAIKKRTCSINHRKIMFGAILAVALLIPLSAHMSTRGYPVFEEFIGNSLKHTSTPLTNNMGLPTLISYHPKYIARRTRTDKYADPFHKWKLARQKTIKNRAVLNYGLLLGFFAMLFIIGRKVEDWETTALSVCLLFGIFEMTCYYYSFMILLAPVALRRWRYVVAVLAMTITTQAAQLRIKWYDEQYTLCSLAVFLCLAYIMGDMTYRVLKKKPLSYSEDPEEIEDVKAADQEEAFDEHLEDILTGRPESIPPVEEEDESEEETPKNQEAERDEKLSDAPCEVLPAEPTLVRTKK